MKFTSGYWLVRKEMTPLYAVEYADHRILGKELTIYAPEKHITGRGDCLNIGMLTVRLTSPMEDVIKVSITHFQGEPFKGPFAPVKEIDPKVSINETETEIIYQSGHT
ncbi:MAG: alpha-xylosidase, partial [Lachnospiraceae bacterium]|nr:alpha-xylosidase [Lachnospiraceae bacterium]